MAVSKKVLLVAFGLIGLVALVMIVGRVRADRADARVAEIFDQTEIDQMTAIRDAYGPWVREIDNGEFGELDQIDGLRDDARYQALCDDLIAIEQRANDELFVIDNRREVPFLRHARWHLTFLSLMSNLGLFTALHDNGMVDEAPPSVPLWDQVNLDDALDYDRASVTSSGILDGLPFPAASSQMEPLSVLGRCVIESPSSDILRLGDGADDGGDNQP